MSWESVVRRTCGAVSDNDELWHGTPAMRIGENGVVFNQIAASAFGFHIGDGICAFIDREKQQIAFKHVGCQEEADHAFKLRSANKHRKGSSSLTFSSQLIRDFAASLGALKTSFALRLNGTDRLIIGQLDMGTNYGARTKVAAD